MAHATEVLPARRRLTHAEMAAAGFLARYTGHTLTAYRLDLRLLFEWCEQHGLDVLDDVTRPHVELFARHLEQERRNGPSSVARRMATIKSFYRLAAIDDIIPKSPAEHIRLPRVHRDDSRVVWLDRLELGAMIATARQAASPSDAALFSMMGLLGLRVSEACAVQVRDTQHIERNHRVLRLIGKGHKPATLPIPIPVARDIDRAIGERGIGPVLLRRDGTAMNRASARRVVERIARKAGIDKHVHPHALRHAFVTACLDAGVPLRDVQIAARHSDPRQTARYDRARGNLDRHANYIVAGFISGAA